MSADLLSGIHDEAFQVTHLYSRGQTDPGQPCKSDRKHGKGDPVPVENQLSPAIGRTARDAKCDGVIWESDVFEVVEVVYFAIEKLALGSRFDNYRSSYLRADIVSGRRVLKDAVTRLRLET